MVCGSFRSICATARRLNRSLEQGAQWPRVSISTWTRSMSHRSRTRASRRWWSRTNRKTRPATSLALLQNSFEFPAATINLADVGRRFLAASRRSAGPFLSETQAGLKTGCRQECRPPNYRMSWQPEIDEIRRREELARLMGGSANVERTHAAGRLTVRERIERLLDPGTFHESGALAGQTKYDAQGILTSFTPSNFVAGTGRIDARPVVVGGDDFTVRGGAADASVGNKMGHAEKLARGMRMPMVRLVDGTGGGGSVKTIETIGRTYVPANPAWDTITAMLGEVPVIGACLGPVAGLGAVRV